MRPQHKSHARMEQLIVKYGHIRRFPAQTTLYFEGDPCSAYLMVLEGSVTVKKTSDDGHEINLYRIGPGQACKLTNTCLLGGKRYPAAAVSETDTKLVQLPADAFHRLIRESDEFRAFTFSGIEDGITDLVHLVEQVAFGPMDGRLAGYLIENADANNTLAATHKSIATELGTAREVISRLLKSFERQDWVKLGRSRITIVNTDALNKIAVM